MLTQWRVLSGVVMVPGADTVVNLLSRPISQASNKCTYTYTTRHVPHCKERDGREIDVFTWQETEIHRGDKDLRVFRKEGCGLQGGGGG